VSKEQEKLEASETWTFCLLDWLSAGSRHITGTSMPRCPHGHWRALIN